jgi:two-component system, OmpR family, response regulator MtrA
VGHDLSLSGFVGCSYRHLTPLDHDGKVINAVTDRYEDSSDVLLIAGDTDVAEMYRMKLEMDGYRVSAIADVGDSTAHAAGWRPDMVLLDVGAGSGAQLRDLERLRADPLLADVPVLLLSNRSEEELRQRGFTLGPTDYLLRSL